MTQMVYSKEQQAVLAHRAAADGCVLLKNDDNTLPLRAGSRIALFGRAQFHYYKSGTGSGGLVNTRAVDGIREALGSIEGYHCDSMVDAAYQLWLRDHPYEASGGWAKEPWFQDEMPLEEALVAAAAQRNDAAVFVIGRTAGEEQDNADTPGSFRLTEQEEQALALVCRHFRRSIVLLNTGNILDMSWVEKYNPAAVLYAWQGGQEGGHAVCDILTGRVCPSGRLTDTIAACASDYPVAQNFGGDTCNFYREDIYVGYRYFESFCPDKVLYPFGYGLSYTTFEKEVVSWDRTADKITAVVCVTNRGRLAGKDTVLFYVQAPQGKLGKPSRTLCAFGKTRELAAGEHETLCLQIPLKNLASYDDSGKTGYRAAWVLESGTYQFFMGGSVRDAAEVFSVSLPFTVIEQLSSAAAPQRPFQRMRRSADGALEWEDVPLAAAKNDGHAEENSVPYRGAQGAVLSDVAQGSVTLDSFLSQLTNEDLCCLVRGEGMNSPRVTPGTAGAIGGVSDRLQTLGLPAACCSDGPSGLRLDCGTTAFSLPNGTCLACTFDEKLCEELFAMEGLELRKNHIDLLLGPGMNLHRYPLNGRNFEYFSEDPLLTGKIAAAQLRGLAHWGVQGTIKHFACNNQEKNRCQIEAVVSERALRELYLRGFEIAIREGGPCAVMTAYNPVNGFQSASHYDLVTKILREQWGFTGIVMSDWWADGSDFGRPSSKQNVAAMIRAGNDLHMVTEVPAENTNGDNLEQSLAEGTLSRQDLLRCAKRICRYLMQSSAFLRRQGVQSELDRQLEAYAAQQEEESAPLNFFVKAAPDADIDPTQIPTEARKTVRFEVQPTENGPYKMTIVCRAAQGNTPMTRIPFSVFVDRTFLQTITLTGDQTEWQTVTVALPREKPGPFSVKFYFGMGGLELRIVKIRKGDEER